jgi:hypothetical protein
LAQNNVSQQNEELFFTLFQWCTYICTFRVLGNKVITEQAPTYIRTCQGLPDFSWDNTPIWGTNVPNGHKLYQKDRKIFQTTKIYPQFPFQGPP